MNRNKGFTLIELLVVVAIIGILSGIVLTSLGTARTKAKDASVKGSMSSMRAEAEIAADTAGGSYPGTLCSAGGALSALQTAITNQGATGYGCNVTAGAWAAQATLNDGTLFCVDSTGFAGKPSATKGSDTYCHR